MIIIVRWIMICKNIKMLIINLEAKACHNLWTTQSVKTASTHQWTLPNYKTQSTLGILSRIIVKVLTTSKQDCIILRICITKISAREVRTWCTQTTKPLSLMTSIRWAICKALANLEFQVATIRSHRCQILSKKLVWSMRNSLS